VREADLGVGDLPGAGLAAQLGEDLRRLRHAGGAERMAAADQSAARVDDDVTAVVAPAGGDERPGLPLGAEAQLLVGDQLGDGEAVVDLGDVDVPGADAGRLVRRRRARCMAGQCA